MFVISLLTNEARNEQSCCPSNPVCSGAACCCSHRRSAAAHEILRIGFLAAATPATAAPLVEALKQGLREHGYVEGQNIVLDLRFGEGKAEQFTVLLLPNWFV